MRKKYNIAIIFAGGTGQRMNTQGIPKQFLKLHSKPIIIYTLEQFEQNELIDAIIVVCIESGIGYLQELIKNYGLKKVVSIIPGGSSGQESIYNGLQEAERLYSGESIVLIHDGVRPIIDDKTIMANIQCTKENGNSITVVKATETIVLAKKAEITSILKREDCLIARAPQSFLLKDIISAHRMAQKEGYKEAVDSAMLMKHYGYKLHCVEGKPENIKITTPSDFYVFRAYIDAKENAQILGL